MQDEEINPSNVLVAIMMGSLGQRGQKVKTNRLIPASATRLFIQRTCIGASSMPGSTEGTKPNPDPAFRELMTQAYSISGTVGWGVYIPELAFPRPSAPQGETGSLMLSALRGASLGEQRSEVAAGGGGAHPEPREKTWRWEHPGMSPLPEL